MTDHDDFSTPFGLGGIASPHDPLDSPVVLDEAAIVPARFLLKGIPKALNQGNTPKCGGYSGAGLKMVQERADGHGFLAFDPTWIYANAQEYDTIPMPHTGTTARGVCKALQKIGPRIIGRPGSEAHHWIASYYAVPFTYAAIKRSIHQYRTPVLIGTSWYRSWFHPVRGILPAPDVHEGDGHLFFAWGWDDNVRGVSLLCQNSWGQYAGSVNGRFYAPATYLLPAVHDAWRLNDIKGD